MSQVPQITRVQELIYELPIERVMTQKVITVSPDTTMSELKEILRVNRISGTPVVDEGRLVGIISIEDLIKALEKGNIHAPVRERMATNLITAQASESVVEAVKKFAQFKVGRLPVVNEQGELVGILTSGDITRGLLEAIGLDYHAEEISRYRPAWTTEALWSAYARLERDKVRGAGSQRVLTDLISLVRRVVQLEDELVPYPHLVQQRYADWLAAQAAAGRRFTGEQRRWLDKIAEAVGLNLAFTPDDFRDYLFDQGGLFAARRLFGDDLPVLLDELNEVLVV